MEKGEVRDCGFSSSDHLRLYDRLTALTPYQEMLNQVIAAVPHDARYVLDASCGTACFEIGYLKCNTSFSGRIVGVDYSDDALALAQSKVGDDPRVTLIRQDLNKELHFNSEAFDCVVSVNTLHAIESPPSVISEFCRVLKPGGKLVLVVPKAGLDIGLVLKAHCNERRNDPFWQSSLNDIRKIIEYAIKSPSLRNALLKVTSQSYEHSLPNKQQRFFQRENVRYMLSVNGFSVIDFAEVYAGQSLFFVARKSSIST
jgi:ubiquinone/menaquinone biosynthesis C-methylase UbiE